ncbi:MAG: U32 family peptidase [Thermodesulfobacteriota bacterium]
MLLTVPTTYTASMVESLAALNQEFAGAGRVAEIYGSLQSAPFNSARPAKYLPAPTRKQFRRHVEQAARQGIAFNYLINAPSYANYEYTSQGRADLEALLIMLVESGVRSVTVAVPYLARIISSRFPSLEVVTSTIGYVGGMRGIEQWLEAGAQRIVLDMEANRDFRFLRRAAEESPVPLEVIANPVCLCQCHYKFNHNCVAGHGSQGGQGNVPGQPYNGFYLNWCFLKKLANPGEFLKSPWMRPEDLGLWQKAGIQYFKLAGRGMPEQQILGLTRAYLSGRHEGDLLELLGWPHWLGFRKNADGTMLPPLAIRMPNQALAGFLDYFAEKTPDCRLGCKGCEYCTAWGKRVLELGEPGLIDRYVVNMRRNLEDLAAHLPTPEEDAALRAQWQGQAASQVMDQ